MLSTNIAFLLAFLKADVMKNLVSMISQNVCILIGFEPASGGAGRNLFQC